MSRWEKYARVGEGDVASAHLPVSSSRLAHRVQTQVEADRLGVPPVRRLRGNADATTKKGALTVATGGALNVATGDYTWRG